MAQPLRDLNKALDQVRLGDATRSDYFRNPTPAHYEEQPALSSSSEGSEDEEDPEQNSLRRLRTM